MALFALCTIRESLPSARIFCFLGVKRRENKKQSRGEATKGIDENETSWLFSVAGCVTERHISSTEEGEISHRCDAPTQGPAVARDLHRAGISA
jgi:hypothetical protein